MLATSWRTLSSSPRPIDDTPITTATPMTIPSTVNAERSLLLRIVSVAIRTISSNSLFRIIVRRPASGVDPDSPFGFVGPKGAKRSLHLKAQRNNRVQLGRFAGRVDPKKYSYGGCDHQSRSHCPQLNR